MDAIATIGSWAEQWMDQYGGGNNWDWDGSDSVFAGYTDRYGVTFAASELSAYTVGSTHSMQQTVAGQRFGPSPAVVTVQFDHAYSSADTFTWTVEQPLGTGAAPLIVGVPPVFAAHPGAWFPLHLSEGAPQTAQPAATWMQSLSLPLSSMEIADVSMLVTEEQVSATATLTALATGRVAMGLNSPWNGHYFWFIGVAALAQQFNADPAVKVVGASVAFPVQVQLTGTAAVSSSLQVESFVVGSSPVTRTCNAITHPSALPLGASPAT